MKKNYFRIICAILALCFVLPMFAGCAEEVPEETRPVTEPDYSPMKGEGVEYLTARSFAPDRTAGEVSEDFRKAYVDFSLKLLNECRGNFEGDALLVPKRAVREALNGDSFLASDAGEAWRVTLQKASADGEASHE